jgi:hypothetical protein
LEYGIPNSDDRGREILRQAVGACWNEAATHYDEPRLAMLLIAIANINVWSRLNVATTQPAGVWKP